MANRRVRTQGARMFGKTSTAIILFDGPIVPRYVYYYGGEIPCRVYQPTRQFCYTCRNAGHWGDVCPEPTVKACKNCNLQNPDEGNKCEPECALCGGVHMTAAPECRNKLKRVPPRGRPPTQPTTKATKHQSRPGTENIPKKRWLSFYRDGSSLPERSRSRSKSGSRTSNFYALGGVAGPCALAKVANQPVAYVSPTVVSVVQAPTPSPGFTKSV
ncbi:hypothetical protein HPB49_025705 [Dermacentor silvarum]|nr:hypothetical protein HPB49_025705 [Dermacentor silvarum]